MARDGPTWSSTRRQASASPPMTQSLGALTMVTATRSSASAAASTSSTGARIRQFCQRTGRPQAVAAASQAPERWRPYMADASMSANMSSMSDHAPKAKSALVSPEESPSAADGFNPRMPSVNSAWA